MVSSKKRQPCTSYTQQRWAKNENNFIIGSDLPNDDNADNRYLK